MNSCMTKSLPLLSAAVGAVATTAVFLLASATQDPQQGPREQMVWTLDDNGNPSQRVTLRSTGNDEWQPVLWTSFYPNGKKSAEGVKVDGERVPDKWKNWDQEGKPVDRMAQVASLRKAITELMAKPEHTDENIEVQHLLIGFKGAPRMTATRSKDQAEELAADLFAQLQNGGDMDALVKAHTDDSYPGKYPMTTSSRRQMVAGFGNVGWRLAVGEIGVAPHDPKSSPFGWHIIKRIK